MNQPMYLLINLAIGGGWAGPPTSASEFPAQMSIDWVRIYASSTALSGTGVLPASAPVTINGTTATSGSGTTVSAPVVAAVTTSPASGSASTGSTVTLTVIFSSAVTVTGAPTLALNDGGTATYTSGSGSSALLFSYTVAAGQNASDLALAASNAIALNGGTIRDSSGNAAVLTGADGYNPAGTLVINPAPGTPATPIYITPGFGSFTDAAGNVYSIDGAGNAMENGAMIPAGDATGAMEYSNGTVYGNISTPARGIRGIRSPGPGRWRRLRPAAPRR